MYGWLNGRNVRFGADDGAGGGGDPTPPAGGAGNAPNPPAGQKPGGQQQPTPTGDGTGTPGSNAGSGADEKKFTQAELEAAIKDRLDRAQKAADAKAEKDRKAADDKALADQAEWQKLAEKREAEVGALTPKAELADKLIALLNTQLDGEIAKFPSEVKAMDPGADNVEARMEWMEKARPLAAKLAGQGPTPGNPRPPKATGAAQAKPDENRRPTVRL